MQISFLHNKASDPIAQILLAHGAMAPMDNPFLEALSSELSDRSVSVARFEFSYMAKRREAGKKSPPPRADRLLDEYRAAANQVITRKNAAIPPLLIGGKSLGGRVASMVADDLYKARKIAGLTCLGYPFHPPKKPEQLRTAHLELLDCPALILQGERDPFGTPTEIEAYKLDPRIHLQWISDGDHDFGPRGRSGFTKKGNIAAAADAIRDFAISLQKM